MRVLRGCMRVVACAVVACTWLYADADYCIPHQVLAAFLSLVPRPATSTATHKPTATREASRGGTNRTHHVGKRPRLSSAQRYALFWIWGVCGIGNGLGWDRLIAALACILGHQVGVPRMHLSASHAHPGPSGGNASECLGVPRSASESLSDCLRLALIASPPHLIVTECH